MIESLISRVDLSEEEAEASLELLLQDGDEALISAFLVLLRAKGETFQEVILSISAARPSLVLVCRIHPVINGFIPVSV